MFFIRCLLLAIVATATPLVNKVSFVPPLSPRVTSASATPSAIIASGYGLAPSTQFGRVRTTHLFSAKKKSVVATPKKVQVKLLKHIAGTGQAGDVIMVTPAFYNNKLRPTKSAEIISDDQVLKEKLEAKARQDVMTSIASSIKDQLQDESFILSISRKSGPEGQLFGGIGPKVIMEELSKCLPNEIWESKSVRITSLIDEKGNAMKGDIKHIGKFSAEISLIKGVDAKIAIEIVGHS